MEKVNEELNINNMASYEQIKKKTKLFSEGQGLRGFVLSLEPPQLELEFKLQASFDIIT